jgi:hypothetical protein
MDGCGSSRRGKAGKCDARLTKLFADIAPEASRISSGVSGAESHAKRLDDVFGSLNHTLSGAAAPPPPTLASLEAPPAPAAPSSRRPAKKPRRKGNAPRRPPPKPGYTIETLGRPSSAAAERGAAMSFLRELRERRGGGEAPAENDDAEDAAPRFRKRPRRAGGTAAPKRDAAVLLSHLGDMDDGL